MKFLLKLKSWQLFVVFLLGMFFTSDSSYGFFIGVALFVIYASWIYQVGVTMYNLIPLQTRPNIQYFKISYYLMPIFVLTSNLFYIYFEQFFSPNAVQIFSIILPCFGAWNWFYISMFAARMLESVIEGQLVKRSDSLKGFVCILMGPFGVWYIQPAVKRVLNKYKVLSSPVIERKA